jgi:hypothetical protein
VEVVAAFEKVMDAQRPILAKTKILDDLVLPATSTLQTSASFDSNNDMLSRNPTTTGNSNSGLIQSLSKLTKSLALSKLRSEKVSDLSAYIELLCRLFTKSQMFLEWTLYFSSPPLPSVSAASSAFYSIPPSVRKETLERLHRIADFLGRIVAGFVVMDLEILLDRYLKKMGQVAALP